MDTSRVFPDFLAAAQGSSAQGGPNTGFQTSSHAQWVSKAKTIGIGMSTPRTIAWTTPLRGSCSLEVIFPLYRQTGVRRLAEWPCESRAAGELSQGGITGGLFADVVQHRVEPRFQRRSRGLERGHLLQAGIGERHHQTAAVAPKPSGMPVI